jgi:hypothetical protein
MEDAGVKSFKNAALCSVSLGVLVLASPAFAQTASEPAPTPARSRHRCR